MKPKTSLEQGCGFARIAHPCYWHGLDSSLGSTCGWDYFDDRLGLPVSKLGSRLAIDYTFCQLDRAPTSTFKVAPDLFFGFQVMWYLDLRHEH